jgi:glycosyltransferase involved in cell wall biosynthesis
LKIVINTSHQRFGGAIQVALSFIHECRSFPEHDYYVWIGQGIGKSLDTSVFPSNFHFYHFDFGEIAFSTIKLIQKTLRPLEENIKPDVIMATSGPSYYHSIAPQIIGFNLPLYIYPESPFIRNLPWQKKLNLWIKKQIHFYYFKRDAIGYVVQTDDVGERVKKVLKINKVFTVTNNHSNFYLDDSLIFSQKLPNRLDNEFRFLTITSYYGHKNLEIIKEIIPLLQKKRWNNVKFVLTLKEEDFQKYIGEHPNIINVGPLRPQECPSLYRECDAMFLPTLAECFSASYPEAMIMHKPIITTDLGFARSICGKAALYFEPMNARKAAEQIEKLCSNPWLQIDLKNKGIEELKKFDSPFNRAKKYLDICKKICKI